MRCDGVPDADRAGTDREQKTLIMEKGNDKGNREQSSMVA